LTGLTLSRRHVPAPSQGVEPSRQAISVAAR
jgi:hypothetical protein